MPHTADTLAELRAKLALRWEASAFWTVEDADDALAMICRIWQAARGTWTAGDVATGNPNDPYVTAPNLALVTAVRYQEIPLVRTSIPELSHLRPNWRVEAPGPLGMSRPHYWAPVGLTTVAVWPVPTAVFSLSFVGWTRPPLSDGPQPATTVDLPPGISGVIIDAAAWWAAGKSSAAEQQARNGGLQALLDAMLPDAEYAAVKAPFRRWAAQEPSPTFPRPEAPTA